MALCGDRRCILLGRNRLGKIGYRSRQRQRRHLLIRIVCVVAFVAFQVVLLRRYYDSDQDENDIAVVDKKNVADANEAVIVGGDSQVMALNHQNFSSEFCQPFKAYEYDSTPSKDDASNIGVKSRTMSSSRTPIHQLWQRHQPELQNMTLQYFNIDATENLPSSSAKMRKAYQTWVQSILSLFSPARLERSVHSQWVDRSSLQAITEIIQRRRVSNSHHTHHHDNMPPPPPPLQVVVLGGSVTAGHGCHVHPLVIRDTLSSSTTPTTKHDATATNILQQQLSCAWPARIQHLIHNTIHQHSDENVVVPTAVNVSNLAMAATTSDVGALMLRYDLWPPKILQRHENQQPGDFPHVILVAFAWNDALSNATIVDVQAKVESLLQVAKQRQEGDDGEATQRDCGRLPLVVLVDDFIGVPGQPFETFRDFHRMMKQLAQQYQVPLISVADAVHDMKKADLDMLLQGSTSTNIHPGMAFHMAVAWIVAYNLFHLAGQSCSEEVEADSDGVNKDWHVLSEQQPVTVSLKSTTVLSSCNKLHSTRPPRCAYVWVAHRVVGAKHAQDVAAAVEPYLTFNDGWRAAGKSRYNKHGWLAELPNSAFGWRMTNLTTHVKAITILSMVSYGYLWKDSRLAVTVINTNTTVEISGEHQTKSSVIEPHTVALPKSIRKGGSLEMEFRLTGGSTFKITGMAFCSKF